MSLEKEFVPYEQALELKELGLKIKSPAVYNPNGVLFWKFRGVSEEDEAFDVENVVNYYDELIEDRIDAPTFSQAFRWFREKYDIFPIIQPYFNSNELTWNIVFMTNFSVNEEGGDEYQQIEITGIYEEAELACLKKLIEIVKSSKIT